MVRPGNSWLVSALLAGALLTFMLGGCATGLRTGDLKHYTALDDCKALRHAVDSNPEGYGSNEELLFAMDAAMAFMRCGDDAAAQRWFREADRLGEELWTESISRQAASFLTGDYVLKYSGEDYERVMVNLMSALGFLRSGDLDSALVEFRRLDSLLNLYNAKYEKKNVYAEDAFARYLSGILHEDDGAFDDAFIAYLRATRVYGDYQEHYGTRLPRILKEDLLRMAAVVDREEDARDVLPDVPANWTPPHWPAEEFGRIVYIQLTGEPPRKVEDRVLVPTKAGPVSIAFPRMVIAPPACGGGRLALTKQGSEIHTDAVLVQDINRIAVKNLADRQVRIVAKTLARAAAKQIVIGGIANSTDDPNAQAAISTALNIVNMFVERADTRSWQTLPGEIYMTRVFASPGTYRLRLTSCGEGRELPSVTVAAGETRYIIDDARHVR
jgi:tetratricopeptide (TPR) repeat protein